MTNLTLNRRLVLSGATLAVAGLATPAMAGLQTRAAFDGLRKTIAVDLFQATDAVGGSVTAEGMTAMLTQALVEDGRFLVVEGSGGGMAPSAIVRAAVTKFEAAAGGGGLSISGGPLGGLLGGRASTRSQTAVMEIALRLIDAATGQVVSTSSAQGRASSRTSEAGLVESWGGGRLGGEIFRATPIGQAGQDAIMKAVDQIAGGMRAVEWSALVVDAAENGVYLNAGADRNIQSGLTLSVWRPGRTLTDPGTGEVLDVEMARIGRVRVETVRARLSIASVIDGEPPMRGDVLKAD
ncbi:MAG: CsgG/HfaB family protein [Alphaproteobacteria bacterium]|uniref:CsgG/HfaB family protein n=2 Tax=Brevundimonas sp. TaxID=1871086 RepID=UPI001D2EA800|nr:CsgG/HfaB family protein [Brevundimonas sp.]MBU3970384.1 CsgG/HfaB family protein [Alphaproteobacteria bacterium]MBU4038131.1 CsgG/HfaB family protein [Alphaproteobacteria bacterium]MBU4135990.1 CsgG/HfaB family protein [Alphaproteobacteria bacterium]